MSNTTISRTGKTSDLKENSDQVVHLSTDENYTYVHYKNGEKLLLSYTLKRLEELLKPFREFIRIHFRHLVNRQFIKTSTKFQVRLKNGA